MARGIEVGGLAQAVGFGIDDLGAELELPEELEGLAAVVVVEAGEGEPGGVAFVGRELDVIDEPLAMAGDDGVTRAGDLALGGGAGEERRGRGAVVGAVRLEQALHELLAGAAGVGKAVLAAGGLELVAAELGEELAEADAAGGGDAVDEVLLAAAPRGEAGIPGELGDAVHGEGGQDRGHGGGGGGGVDDGHGMRVISAV
ncbi:MAG: hypothetical protein R3B72_18760 [Polyangiaceae bacterium]